MRAMWVAVLVLVTAGCGSRTNTVGGGNSTQSSVEGACAALVEFEGLRYLGAYTPIAPLEGSRLGSGSVPACNDTPGGPPGESTSVEVFELMGVSPDVAITSGGSVFIRDDADFDHLPAPLSRLLRAPECVPADEPIELSGRWLGIMGTDGKTESVLDPPYDVRIQVAESSSDRYERAELTIRVPPEAGRQLDRDDLRESLWEQATLSITARCNAGVFEAVTVTAQPPRD